MRIPTLPGPIRPTSIFISYNLLGPWVRARASGKESVDRASPSLQSGGVNYYYNYSSKENPTPDRREGKRQDPKNTSTPWVRFDGWRRWDFHFSLFNIGVNHQRLLDWEWRIHDWVYISFSLNIGYPRVQLPCWNYLWRRPERISMFKKRSSILDSVFFLSFPPFPV